MGLFNLFKKPVVVQDALFGLLRLTEVKDEAKNFFVGRCHFAPANATIGLLINAGKEGPTEEQRQFYKHIAANFSDYTQKAMPLIEEEFSNWKTDFRISDFDKEFTLDSITIPRLGNQPPHWEMTFTTTHDINHWVSVEFIGNEAEAVLIDG